MLILQRQKLEYLEEQNSASHLKQDTNAHEKNNNDQAQQSRWAP